MYTQRLFEILYYLLHHKKTTARQLAELFEVSIRTIYRDLDTLTLAGIPIFTNRGREGGIYLMDSYVMNRSLLSDQQQKEILTALSSVETLSATPSDTLPLLSHFFGKENSKWIQIDLSDWSMEKQQEYQILREAILTCHVLSFTYYSAEGKKSKRTVYPLQLWFKEHAWYLIAYCTQKKAQRTFRLSRIQHPKIQKECFSPMEARLPQAGGDPAEQIALHLRIDSSMAFRVYDEFSYEQIHVLPDGSFDIHVSYPAGDWILSQLLSYGAALTVLSPAAIRQRLLQELKAAQMRYEDI